MKRVATILFALLMLATCTLCAQEEGVLKHRRNRTHVPHQHYYGPDQPRPTTFIKDKGVGGPLNFGFAFAPVFSWMYPSSEGYTRDGAVVGMRYGIPLNINLTQRKSFYVCTGVHVEQIGGALSYRNGVSIPQVGISENSPVHSAFHATYLTIPLGVTLKTRSLNNFFVCGNAGIYSSVLLQGNTVDSYVLGTETWTRSKQPYKDAATFKEAAFGGLGFEYSVTPTMRAGIMANYVQSFTNFFKGNHQAYNSVLKVDPVARMGYFELELHINFF